MGKSYHKQLPTPLRERQSSATNWRRVTLPDGSSCFTPRPEPPPSRLSRLTPHGFWLLLLLIILLQSLIPD
ncbi:hypothetical protein THUN1379_25770 [Paludibacterium sp. THUN1379]|nr:hypothetical protein THUN1379_25770 [Paludibacterium sp. THUN1379]